ncbi:MAG: cytochrome c biogenesis CcdA family protein [Actinomycetota bacterium]
MSDFLVDQVFDGGILLASLVALIAGLISFASPCVIPLVPGYLAYVGGVAGSRRKVLTGATLFVLGFSILFISYGALFGELGSRIISNGENLARLLGALTVLFGLIFLFPEKFYRSYKIPFLAKSGILSAPLLGFMFGLGWTPCIGPTLAAVQTISIIEASALRGAILSFAYCIGLGLPFILFALLIDKSKSLQEGIARRGKLISIIGGVFLITIGLMQIFGIWESLMAGLRGTIADFVPVV